MGFCIKCKEFVAPDFMVKKDLCAFCQKGSNVIINDEGTIFTKQDVCEDYKILLNKLKDSKGIKEKHVDILLKTEMSKNEKK
jgi:hypothetical protein